MEMSMKDEKRDEMQGNNHQKQFRTYWWFVLVATIAVAEYPIYMGIKVVHDMAVYGAVLEESFPKYIIPYTPIAITVLTAVLLLPVLVKKVKRFALLTASGISMVVFFVTELLLESKVIVTATVQTTLESWQMYMCYVSPTEFETRKWRAIDVLIGDYSPTFKIHFYLISVVLILTILSCLYGFAEMILSDNRKRKKALTVQAVCTALFLGLCILACFTAFFRDGELTVSLLSAFLMCVFFLLLGVTVGTYAGSFLLGKRKWIAVGVPMVVGAVTTLAMYIGELCLLSGHLYRFGENFFCKGLPGIVLAPVDVLIVLLAGAVSGGICHLLNKKTNLE